MFKQTTFKPKGMQRDISKTSFSKEYAYAMKNMRLTVLEDGTLGCITNEKGTKALDIKKYNALGSLIISGIPLGQAIVDNVYVLFTHDKSNNTDYIYKIWEENNNLVGAILYSGNLNFKLECPIETLSYYENNKVRKVYWTDNYNQPRLINIDADYNITVSLLDGSSSPVYDSTVFDFVPTLKLQEFITIERTNASDGQFPAGVVQYSFTYFNLYGQESNIFYTSPLYYTSFSDRGANAEEKVGNAFKINIKNVDIRFDYLRVYCTIRTSIDGNVLSRKVKDVKIKKSSNISDTTITIIDDGIIGEDIDEYSLFYKGGNSLKVKTLNQKDNTLFVGNIEEKVPTLPKDIVEAIQNDTTKNLIKYDYVEVKVPYQKSDYIYEEKSIEYPARKSYYPWENSLKYSSKEITTFQSKETYRFGIQFQHSSGKWSEVIWLGDYKNDIIRKQDFAKSSSSYTYDKVYKTVAGIDISNSNNNTILMSNFEFLKSNNNYIKVRPVVVYPTLADRNILCQGILCPTVFNVGDRKTNAPYAQSSWFIRPNLPKEVSTDTSSVSSLKGSFSEFRNYHPLPANTEKNAEIQCNDIAPVNPVISTTDTGTFDEISNRFVSYFKDNFYVDQSVVTFHSPDIEFDDNLKNVDLSLFKMRIVGVVPITAHSSDLDITAGSTLGLYNKDTLGTGFYKYVPKATTTYNDGIDVASNASRALLSGAYWIDGVARKKNDKVGTDYISLTANQRAYAIYPWHREISLNNDINYATYQASASIKHKRISNFYSSYDSLYFQNSTDIPISDAKLFDSNEITLIKLHSPIQEEEDIVYYGNIDRVITPSVDKVPNIYGIGERDKSDGYDIIISNTIVDTDGKDAASAFIDKYVTLKSQWVENAQSGTPVYKVNDPIHIKYKSTPHVVLTTKGSKENDMYTVNILPTINTDTYKALNNVSGTYNKPFWTNKNIKIIQSNIDCEEDWEINVVNYQTQAEVTPNPGGSTTITKTFPYGFLWLVELYRDTVNNRFGGNDETSLSQNNWLVAGDAVTIDSTTVTVDGKTYPKTLYNLKWTIGDTYYQRYDHIKTYPFTTEDTNSVSEVISFMCETRINLDGRCDKNRLYYNNLIITPEKFNIMNDVYNQRNTYFIYHTIDKDKSNITEYNNAISWGNTKINGSNTDSWTNINLAAALELDGNLGPINSIKKHNNDIVVFQDKGVSIVSYNENVQISSTTGVPIEILNSGKVTGKRYISNTIGSVNKWSICETPMGIVFIDDNSKNIYIYDGQIKNISDAKYFNSWIREHSNLKEWNPATFANYITYYDSINNEILFIGKEDCFVYSLKIAEFTSFYDYNNTPYFFNLYDKSIFIHKDSDMGTNSYTMWEEHAGYYNQFFSEYKNYYIEIIANEEPNKDKIFNNIEYNADTWENNVLSSITFDKITCYNNYQKGIVNLNTEKYKPSTLKRKFRTWRIQVPRDITYKQDRLRDMWLGIKFEHYSQDNTKMLLHDITVTYNSN